MRAYALAIALAGLAGGGAGCTLLVHFDDAPSCDGGLCAADATSGAEGDGGTHAEGGGGPAGEAGVDAHAGHDASDAAGGGVDHYAPCGSLASGYYCATDGLHGYAGSPDDLVNCDDGGIAKVTPCDGGCLPLPAPFPDACNPCPGHPDGLYCGRDLPGFPAINADFLIQCQSGNVVQSVACQHGCNSSATPRACYAG